MEVNSGSDELCRDYLASKATFDEMCSSTGQVRPHWEYLIDALHKLGSKELSKRNQETQRHLRETGVTYNLHEDTENQFSPWLLDPIPFVIGSQEWDVIESGLIQRAELLDLILKDLYGSRQLVTSELIPPELVYAHDGFLRACDGNRSANANSLQLYAADLARDHNGQFLVMGDRTQTPTGAGYALENRTIMRRVLPSLFRDSQVHRLALYFRSIRQELARISPLGGHGKTVLLSPGPYSETYFEHSYLANYLDYALVQGNDLTSRGGKIWLKSLDGLLPVDVILRRVDDYLCDPLELSQYSNQGIPGLMESVRRGHVAVVNPIGSSLLENPALSAFLPKICQQLFGQDLRIPSVFTWWCGQKISFQYVMDHFQQLIIKPIAKHHGFSSIMVSELSADDQQQLKAKISKNPHLFVAQEKINYSTTPTLIDDIIQPRAVMLRSFLSARSDSYVIMPGGLSRIIPNDRPWGDLSANKHQVISKDTWVLASEPERQLSLWNTINSEQSQDEYAGIGSLPSRAADNLFWLGRMAERSEDFIRLFRSLGNKLDDVSEYHDEVDKQVLVILYQSLHSLMLQSPKLSLDINTAFDRDIIEYNLLQMLLDEQETGNLYHIIKSMVSSASSVRDLLSLDTWRVISHIEKAIDKWSQYRPTDLLQSSDELDLLISNLASFSGLILESTTREQGWFFLTIGKRLERAAWVANQIKSILTLPQEHDNEQMLLESLLRSNESILTYRRRYRTNLEINKVLELLLFDQTNPRSLHYQLKSLNHTINSLPRMLKKFELSPDQRLILEALNLLRLSELGKLCMTDPETKQRKALELLLSQIIEKLDQLSLSITQIYFNHSVIPQQLNKHREVL